MHQAVRPEVYRGFGFPGADDIGNMFQYNAELETAYCGARNVSESRALAPLGSASADSGAHRQCASAAAFGGTARVLDAEVNRVIRSARPSICS